MGCTPSKSAVIYTQDRICRDLDTCSTFVPSLKSSASSPERPAVCVETSSGRKTFLSVPEQRDVHAWSGSQSSTSESWIPAGNCVMPRSSTPDPHIHATVTQLPRDSTGT